MMSIHPSRLFTAFRSPFTLIAGIALVLAACSDQTAPVDPIDESVDGIAEIQDLPEFHRGRGNPVVRLALGRTVFTNVPQLEFAGLRTHFFVAHQRQDDGTDARGWTRVNQRGAEAVNQSFVTRGRVVCMNTIEGTANQPDIVVIADETILRVGDPAVGVFSPPFPEPVYPGDEGTVFAFRDNGRGPNAGDESGFRLATNRLFAKLICQSPGDFGFDYATAAANLFPIERGFIKVID